jgi:hypothetical protein
MGSSCGKGSVSQKSVIQPVKADQIGSPVNTEQRLQPRKDIQNQKECRTAEAVKDLPYTNVEKQVPKVEQSNMKETSTESCFSSIDNAKQNHHETVSEARILFSLEQKGLSPPKMFTVVEQKRLVMHQFAQIQRPLDRYVFLMSLQVCYVREDLGSLAADSDHNDRPERISRCRERRAATRLYSITS